MNLTDLIQGLPVRLVRGRAGRICDLTEDSRTVVPGSLFVARAGLKSDGRAYIAEAVKAGAVGVLVQGEASAAGVPGADSDLAVLACEDVEKGAALLAERFYGDPTSKLDLVGVTGTNGKTTTTYLIWQLLNGVGRRCGLVGTVQIDDGRELASASMTTPPSIELSRTFAMMVENGCRSAVIEASSHALDQRRVDALKFDIGVFTNLTHDHLDYHKTMEAYADAKARLFGLLGAEGLALVNAGDPAWERVTRGTRARVMHCETGNRRDGAGCAGEILSASIRGMRLRLAGPWGNIEASVPLIGTYNLMNVLQATAACFELGMDATQLARGLGRIQAPPGRLERVSTPDDAVAVFVDYAHTDDALRNMLTAVNGSIGSGKDRPGVWVVFGCGGDKDKTKRPKMGAAAAELADHVVVTSDNPRSEDPGRIVQEILAGIGPELRGKLAVHVDREMAIRHAVEQAGPGDVVVIAGKGHETEQVLSDGKGGLVRVHFDDREVARDALNQRRRSGNPVRVPGLRGPAGRHAGE
jgi:UDP-N-acetylmuramoyl-L-alanyl-D-glutamate--2,6-diaminopimelate ligase